MKLNCPPFELKLRSNEEKEKAIEHHQKNPLPEREMMVVTQKENQETKVKAKVRKHPKKARQAKQAKVKERAKKQQKVKRAKPLKREPKGNPKATGKEMVENQVKGSLVRVSQTKVAQKAREKVHKRASPLANCFKANVIGVVPMDIRKEIVKTEMIIMSG